MLRAFTAGIGVLLAAQILYVGVLARINHHELLRSVLLAFPFAAAFLTAWLAPRRKMLAGLSMAVFGAAIGVAASFVYERLGFVVDEIGGLAATFLILLAYQGVSCVLGSGLAIFVWRRYRAAIPSN